MTLEQIGVVVGVGAGASSIYAAVLGLLDRRKKRISLDPLGPERNALAQELAVALTRMANTLAALCSGLQTHGPRFLKEERFKHVVAALAVEADLKEMQPRVWISFGDKAAAPLADAEAALREIHLALGTIAQIRDPADAPPAALGVIHSAFDSEVGRITMQRERFETARATFVQTVRKGPRHTRNQR